MKIKILVCTIIVAATTICSAFDGRTRFVGNERNWEIYIFPFPNDSGCYLLHKYSSQNSSYNHRTKLSSLTEQLFLDGTLQSEIQLLNYGDIPDISEIHYYGNGRKEKIALQSWPRYHELMLHKKTVASVYYYDDCSIKGLEIKGDNIVAPRQVLEWDSLHQYYWAGQSVNRPVRDTIEQQGVISGEIILQVRETDKYERSGEWKKYDRLGRLVDSTRYK